jgi:hypothetical protein
VSVDEQWVFAGIGPVGWGVAALLALLAVVSVWVARHPLDRARRPWDWARLPIVRWVARFVPARLDAAAARLRSRLGISGAAAAAGGVGLLVVGALAVAFTALLDDVLEGEGFAQFDNPIAQWLAGHREAWLTKA